MSVDSEALRAEPSSESATAIVGIFNNVAFYRSTGEFVASETLDSALGIKRNGLTSVKVSRPSNSELKLEFRSFGEVVVAKSYVVGTDLLLTPDGRFVIHVPVGCGGKDSPGFGCGTKSVTLFIEARGYLAAVESGGGAGVIGIIPFAVYAKHIALFSRQD